MRYFVVLMWAVPLAAQTPCAVSTFPGSWNGWGAGTGNTRYQRTTSITPANVGRLEVKWAFGFPGSRSVMGQPSVVGGRVFAGTDTGNVYAVDAATGCMLWSYKADAAVRTAITVAPIGNRSAAFFGDGRGKVYAVDAADGKELWKSIAESHPTAKLTGAPVFFDDKLFVPVASGEEGSGGGATYACCTFRGSVVAMAAGSGRVLWRTYVIQDEPKQTGAKANGTAKMGPSGAGIWSPPTIDAKRRQLYVGTGDAYSDPADKATDAIVAMDLDTGKIKWIAQDTENDVWLSTCMGANKPEHCGPDHDFGSPPQLVTIGGRDLLVAGQKSGNVWAHDPDTGAVVWRSPLVEDTTAFGGKVVWGGASDGEKAYFGLGSGGIGAVDLRNGERRWFNAIPPAATMPTRKSHDGPIAAIPGLIFSGGWDGMLRALSAADGKVIWEYNTAREFPTVNGVAAKGGSMGSPGPVVVGDMLFVASGYVGVQNGVGGNVLLAFKLPEGR
ncbi:MAG: PQQ-binding-like beta-propeller repeat protein [Acidobacteriota bacterium]